MIFFIILKIDKDKRINNLYLFSLPLSFFGNVFISEFCSGLIDLLPLQCIYHCLICGSISKFKITSVNAGNMFKCFFSGGVILQAPLSRVNWSLHLQTDCYLKIFEFIIYIKKIILKVHVSLSRRVFSFQMNQRAYVL